MSKKTQKKVVQKKENKKRTFLSDRPIMQITLKSFLIIGLIFSAIFYIDNKG
jgi:hypothetical protein